MANPEYVLEMRDIVKVFPGVRALDGVKLQVRPGKVHVICGENGAGKSTLMKIINGTYVADEGEMFYKGEKIGPHTVQDTLKMGIAMIYQELNPVLEMTIAENIWLGREPRKGRFVDFGKMQKDTQELLDKLDMPYKAIRRCTSCPSQATSWSRSQRQSRATHRSSSWMSRPRPSVTRRSTYCSSRSSPSGNRA